MAIRALSSYLSKAALPWARNGVNGVKELALLFRNHTKKVSDPNRGTYNVKWVSPKEMKELSEANFRNRLNSISGTNNKTPSLGDQKRNIEHCS